MTDESSRTPARPLTDLQHARVDYARHDLESIRTTDIATLDPAGLILVIARLHERLDDMIDLIGEVTRTEPDIPRLE
ncbi:hypothetical protein [Streptomyces acidiscabies]|uniref:hypothetical protein n=1 Tax=Streptomyces acidiscabies TaxID=42234 RepID=UPI0009515547|nr:hypothetical protein [Streptomyces acidiscabies]